MTDAMKKVLTEEEERRIVSEANTFEQAYSIEELREVFDKITAGMSHWKDRIDVRIVVPKEQKDYYVNVAKVAVIYYTATVPTINVFEDNGSKILLCIKSVGYRNGPAGP